MRSDFHNVVIEILKQTKENEIIPASEIADIDIGTQLNLKRDASGNVTIDREKRIELAMLLIRQGTDIIEVINLLTWKDFESFIASILAENSYICTESFRRRGNSIEKGMEIDVIGLRGTSILCIDAKMWGVRGGKISSLRTAAEKQKERTLRLTQQHETLSKKLPALIPGEYELFPILVTWLIEDVELHNGVPVVPVFKFNTFIQDFDQYYDIIVSYRLCF